MNTQGWNQQRQEDLLSRLNNWQWYCRWKVGTSLKIQLSGISQFNSLNIGLLGLDCFQWEKYEHGNVNLYCQFFPLMLFGFALKRNRLSLDSY
jgi:hypothetical protein